MRTMAWQVFGMEGHRQRASFGDSYRLHGFGGDRFAAIDLLAEDTTGTNDYAIIVVTADNRDRCVAEFFGQLSDGIFENCRTGKVEEIDTRDLIELYAGYVPKDWLRTWCEGAGANGRRAFEITEAIFDFDPYCGCDTGDMIRAHLDLLDEWRYEEVASDLREVVDGDQTPEGEALLRIADELELIPVWDAIVNLMDDDIREAVHSDFSPCSDREFLTEYCKRDRRFADLVWREFEIGVDIA